MRVTALWFVSIHLSDRDEPPPRLTRLPFSPLQALTILPSPAFPSPPPTTLQFAPHPRLRLAPCSVSRPSSHLRCAMLDFAAPPRLRPPGRVWFAFRPAPQPRSAPRRPSRLISGSARVSRRSVRARRPHLLSAEPSAGSRSSPARSNPASVGFGLARLVPDLARLNSGPAPLAFGVLPEFQ